MITHILPFVVLGLGGAVCGFVLSIIGSIARRKLKEIQATIKNTALESMEVFSYGMPFYSYKGRLVYFGFTKKHIGLYIPPPIIENHKDELKAYKTSKSAVQFPLDKDLPIALIKKLVKARVTLNNESEKEKNKRYEKVVLYTVFSRGICLWITR